MKSTIFKLTFFLGAMLTLGTVSYASSPSKPLTPGNPNSPIAIAIPSSQILVNDDTLLQTPMGIVPTRKINEKELPSILLPWVDWIKAKNLQEHCIVGNQNEQTCVFAPEIKITETAEVFDFEINGASFLKEFWMKIPSGQSSKVWPENVIINGKSGQIIEQEGFTLVKISKGNFTIKFNIKKEAIKTEPNLMLAQNFLIIKNKTTNNWTVENNQLIWISKKTDGNPEEKIAANVAQNENIKVYRKLIDDIPLRLETRLQIVYSGKEKEIYLGKVLPENFNLLQIDSPLSVIQKEDGFYVNLVSGEHTIRFNSYSFNNLSSINTKNLIKDSQTEYWSIQNNLNIRQTEIKSANSVDPKQAFIPNEWRSLPAFSVKEKIDIQTIRRGLNLQNNLSYVAQRKSWYGFNEEKMTHFDNMNFSNNGKSFMTFDSSILPKEVTINNQAQMIVEHEKKQGIVLKQGNYAGTLQSQTTTEFSNTFISDSKQQLGSWNLTIAPRHRLIHVSGVDKAINSWSYNWNLYTIFAIFLISLSFYKLFGIPLAILSFSSIFLFQSNPFLAWTFWPALLLMMALLKVLPEKNNFTNLVKISASMTLIVISFIFVQFTVEETRYIINPSLERTPNFINISSQDSVEPANLGMMERKTNKMQDVPMSSSSDAGASRNAMLSSVASAPERATEFEAEIKNIENQKIQISTGLPSWSGLTYSIIPSSVMDNKVNFFIAKPWLVSLGSILQIINLFIVIIFLLMYLLNIYKKHTLLAFFPDKLRKNKIINSFLGEKK